MSWEPLEHGATIGTSGSEGGVILRDDESTGAMRITLEQGGSTALFALYYPALERFVGEF